MARLVLTLILIGAMYLAWWLSAYPGAVRFFVGVVAAFFGLCVAVNVIFLLVGAPGLGLLAHDWLHSKKKSRRQ